MKPDKLLVVIDNLGRGGAEMLLMGILPELNSRFRLILVTLSDHFEFDDAQLICAEKYSLGFTGKMSLVPAILKLKKIISQTQPDLVHAHLLHSSIVARAACPPAIPLVFSLHTIMSKDALDNSLFYTWLEKAVLKRRHAVIAVSEAVLEDYRKIIPVPGPAYVLKNYVADQFLIREKSSRQYKNLQHLNLLAVGNIKPVKNYPYLVSAFEQLKSLPVSLHIFGQGDNAAVRALQNEIDEKQVNIVLKGSTDNIAGLLPGFDLFVMCSRYEGFGIAPVEAMSMGLPLLLSDIPVFKEITYGNGLFFNLDDPSDFVRLVQDIFDHKYDLATMSAEGMEIARTNYSKATYVENLFHIYDALLKTRTARGKA